MSYWDSCPLQQTLETNSTFTQLSMICVKHLAYFTFLLLEGKKKHIWKITLLKVVLTLKDPFSWRTKVVKFSWHRKKELTTVQKQYPIDRLFMFPLNIPQYYKIILLKSARFILHRKSFLKNLLRQKKNKNKGNYDYCKWN